jgi:hypothetical protein
VSIELKVPQFHSVQYLRLKDEYQLRISEWQLKVPQKVGRGDRDENGAQNRREQPTSRDDMIPEDRS